MKLYLIRHTAVDVPSGVCYGQSDVPVRETFEVEAVVVKQQLDNMDFDAIFSSPLSRCLKLAQYCGYGDKVVLEDRLKEMYFGNWEMKLWSEISDENAQRWYENWLTEPTDEGESFEILYRRVSSFLGELKSFNYENVAIFAHGGVINCARIYGGIITFEKAFDKTPTYGEITCVEI